MMDRLAFSESLASLNDEQLDAVSCDVNCVVTAGAGSGKTTVLAHRFFRLVAEGKAHADEILTLTFSRLAAAEMFERIHAKLHEYRDDPDIREELNRFGEATITTIDAFCNRIVASDPLCYGIGADFRLDEEENRRMATECATNLCTRMDGHAGLMFLASLYNPEELVSSLFAGLCIKWFHPASTFDPQMMTGLLTEQIELLYGEQLAVVLDSCQLIGDLKGSGKTLVENQEAAAMLLGARPVLEQAEDPLFCLGLLERVKLKKCRGKQDHVEICNEAVEKATGALELARGSCAALLDRTMIEPVHEVLGRLHESYMEMKRERGILSFSDVAQMAREILLHNRQVRRHYQQKYRYIMIDEFQDTNRLQKELVYLLAQSPSAETDAVPLAHELKPDKLFFVGDEKQSIYRFRGADVSVFKQLDREISESGGRRIVLRTNYRSEPRLIRLFNTIFERVMGDATKEYEARFSPLESRKETEGITVRLSLLHKPKDDDAGSEELGEEEADSVQSEAYAIARLIHRMTGTDEYMIAERNGGLRRPRHEDIAILLRTSGNQMHFEKALRIAGIPYTLSALQSLFLESPANDLYLLLQLVIHPDDRLAFAGILRSPFCRISDDSLLPLLDRMEETGTVFPPATDLLAESEDLGKYTRCATLYQQLCALARSASVATLVSYLWHEGGYRHYLLADVLFQVYLEHFEYLLELAMDFDERGEALPDFLDYLRPRLGTHENLTDLEPLGDRTGGVRIMTIHKSKGLEFPIVIVANMGTTSRPMVTPPWHEIQSGDRQIPVVRHMRPYGTMGNILYERDKEMLQGMESAEMKRLFYVALTRAKFHLVLSGCQNGQNLGPKSTERNFLALLANTTGVLDDPSALGEDFTVDRIEGAPVSVLTASVSQGMLRQTIERMAPAYGQPRGARVAKISSVSVTQIARERESADRTDMVMLPVLASDAFVLERDLSGVFGTWCHLVLQDLTVRAGKSLAACTVTAEDVLPMMPQELVHADLPASRLRLIASCVATLVENFLTSDLLHFLINDDLLTIESEVAFSMRSDDDPLQVISGTIDLLLRYDSQIRIIDFKSDAYAYARQHEGQLALYRRAAFRLYPGLPVSSAVCYLRQVDPVKWVTEGS